MIGNEASAESACDEAAWVGSGVAVSVGVWLLVGSGVADSVGAADSVGKLVA